MNSGNDKIMESIIPFLATLVVTGEVLEKSI